MNIEEKIEKFLAASAFGVVGASTKRHKYGNKVLRCYLQNGKTVIGVNPLETEIEGVRCVTSVTDLPQEVHSISIITPPEVTTTVVDLAIEKGIENLWMQPGAENPDAVAKADQYGLNVIADGSCLLVVLGFNDH